VGAGAGTSKSNGGGCFCFAKTQFRAKVRAQLHPYTAQGLSTKIGQPVKKGDTKMTTITTKDGAEI